MSKARREMLSETIWEEKIVNATLHVLLHFDASDVFRLRFDHPIPYMQTNASVFKKRWRCVENAPIYMRLLTLPTPLGIYGYAIYGKDKKTKERLLKAAFAKGKKAKTQKLIDPEKAEAEDADRVRGNEPAATRGTDVPRFAVPAATTVHAVRTAAGHKGILDDMLRVG